MSGKITVITTHAKECKPISVWKTGLITGLVAAILYMATFLLYFFTDYNMALASTTYRLWVYLGPWLFVLPIFMGMLRVAAWGNRRFHLIQIFKTGFISFQTAIATYLLLLGLLSFIDAGFHERTHMGIELEHLQNWLWANVLIAGVAMVLVVVPGKLPYFRKQVEE